MIMNQRRTFLFPITIYSLLDSMQQQAEQPPILRHVEDQLSARWKLSRQIMSAVRGAVFPPKSTSSFARAVPRQTFCESCLLACCFAWRAASLSFQIPKIPIPQLPPPAWTSSISSTTTPKMRRSTRNFQTFWWALGRIRSSAFDTTPASLILENSST